MNDYFISKLFPSKLPYKHFKTTKMAPAEEMNWCKKTVSVHTGKTQDILHFV